AGFRMALPQWEEEQYNLVRGVLPGGRFGIVLHQLLRTHSGGTDGSDNLFGGSFWAVRTSSPGSWLKALKPDRTWIPYIGDFLDGGTDDTPREAFDAPGAWAPTTTVATPVPETNALLPRVIITLKSRSSWMKTGGAFDLDDYGADGFRLYPDDGDDRDALTRLVRGPAMGLLTRLKHPYTEVRVDYGMLTVRRNGYVLDPAALDDHVQTVCALADAIVAAAGTGVARPSFEAPLADCPWAQADYPGMDPYIAGAWAQDLRGFAAQKGLTLEDPDAWHRAFGSIPLPGRVCAVMRNPHGGRVAFTTDVPIAITKALRGAVLAPAAEGVADTPPGGIRSEFGTVGVHGGVAYAFTHRLFGYTSEAATLIDDALAALRAQQLI
ncbi:MAG TPA: hypothetical protein VFZ89_20050, partial [Solirubrobacteraceae bacterium]